MSITLFKSYKVLYFHNMSHRTRQPAICICKNKEADQLCSNCTADQRLCFRYTDSTIPFLSKCKVTSLCPSSVLEQIGLCRTKSEPQIVGFSDATAHMVLRQKKHRRVAAMCFEPVREKTNNLGSDQV